MNPYRTMEEILPESVGKKRPFYKTLYYKFQILVWGKWKDRFIRCDECLFKSKHPDGMHYDSTMFFHQLKHKAIKLQAAKR